MRNIRPNNKVNKFYDKDEFNLDIEMGREWLDGDNNFTITLYKVDKSTTRSDIYNEAEIDSIQYTTVELVVLPNLQKSENKAYNTSNNSMRFKQDGDFSFIVYEKELEEKNAVISFGDYIGYDVGNKTRRYFEVIDDDIINFENKKTIMGYQRFYKEIGCKTVSPDVFNGL